MVIYAVAKGFDRLRNARAICAHRRLHFLSCAPKLRAFPERTLKPRFKGHGLRPRTTVLYMLYHDY